MSENLSEKNVQLDAVEEIEVVRIRTIQTPKTLVDGYSYTSTLILLASDTGHIFELKFNDLKTENRSDLIDLLLLTEPGDKLKVQFDHKQYGPLLLENRRTIRYAENLDLKMGHCPKR